MNEKEILIRKWRNDPVSFVRERLKMDPEPEQIQTLNAIKDFNRVAVRSGHGIGKTAIEAAIAFWWLFTRPNSMTVCTAPTARQLKDIVWRELRKWAKHANIENMLDIIETRIGIAGHKDEWNIIARSAREPENLAGFHNKYLLYVLEEASGINPAIDETIEGALTDEGNKLLMIGNPTQNSGVFHSAFHANTALYKTLHFNSEDSKRVSKTYIDNMRKKYGRESDIYRVRVLGDFPKGEPDVFIPLWLVEKARMNEVEPTGDHEIGVDPARYGNDESAICHRQGFHIFPLIGFHGINTTRLSGEVAKLVKEIRKTGYKGTIKVKVDETGIGAGVVDTLDDMHEELNIEVIAVNNGAKADEDEEYYNAGAETWGHIKNILPQMELPDDDELTAQLCTRKYKVDVKGRIQLEKKDDMKKRGLSSPDRADALALCITSHGEKTIIVENYATNADYINQ